MSAASDYDSNNYADSNLRLEAIVDDGSGFAKSESVAIMDNSAAVQNTVSYGRIYTYADAVAYGYYTVEENESYPGAGEDEDSATAHITLYFAQLGSHTVGNPTYGAVLYASVSDYGVPPGYERDSWVYMEPLDSDGLYYVVTGVLQQSTYSDPTAEAVEVDDTLLLYEEFYGATVSTQIGKNHVNRTYVFDENTIEVGYSTSHLSGEDTRFYDAAANSLVTTPEP